MLKKARTKEIRPNLKEILRKQGYSISGWCRVHGFVRGSAEYALTYRRNGKHAREIRAKVLSK